MIESSAFSVVVDQALADGLSKGRHYVFPDGEGNNALDPRLLLVEFKSSILLHQSQVRGSSSLWLWRRHRVDRLWLPPLS